MANCTLPSLSPPIIRESMYVANVVDFSHLRQKLAKSEVDSRDLRTPSLTEYSRSSSPRGRVSGRTCRSMLRFVER